MFKNCFINGIFKCIVFIILFSPHIFWTIWLVYFCSCTTSSSAIHLLMILRLFAYLGCCEQSCSKHGVKVSEILFSFALALDPEVGLLDHVAVPCSIFWGIALLFYIGAAPLYERACSWPTSRPVAEMGPEQQHLPASYFLRGWVATAAQAMSMRKVLKCPTCKWEAGYAGCFWLVSQGITDDQSVVILLPPGLLCDILSVRQSVVSDNAKNEDEVPQTSSHLHLGFGKVLSLCFVECVP